VVTETTFWVRGRDLERLYGASRICYVVGGAEGWGRFEAVAQLAGALRLLLPFRERVLAVPVAPIDHIEDQRGLRQLSPELFGGACFIHHSVHPPRFDLDETVPGESGNDEPDDLETVGLVRVVDAPTAQAQVLLYGGGAGDPAAWLEETSEVIEALDAWLDQGVTSDLPPWLAVVGLRSTARMLSGSCSKRLAALFERCRAVGVADEESANELAFFARASSIDLFVSGDEASPVMLEATTRNGSGPVSGASRSRRGRTGGFTLNLHVGWEADRPAISMNSVRHLLDEVRELAPGDVALNLFSDRDRRAPEVRSMVRLATSVFGKNVAISLVACLSQAATGFAELRGADLTISTSPHVALASLGMLVPTLVVRSGVDRMADERIMDSVGLPSDALVEMQGRTVGILRPALMKAMKGSAGTRNRSIDGVRATVATRSSVTLARVSQALGSDHLERLGRQYSATVDRLRETMEELSDLRLEYGRLLNAAAEGLRNAGGAPLPGESAADGYPHLIQRIRQTVQSALPPDATVLVVSKGDDELLNLYGRRAWHFPQAVGGVYAGHHPADSAEAITHLEALRARGADHLLFPRPALWWLNHYAELRQHLESRYSAVVRQKDTCVIFALGSSRRADPGGSGGSGGAGGHGAEPPPAEASDEGTGVPPPDEKRRRSLFGRWRRAG
jgi:hypothetical protein